MKNTKNNPENKDRAKTKQKNDRKLSVLYHVITSVYQNEPVINKTLGIEGIGRSIEENRRGKTVYTIATSWFVDRYNKQVRSVYNWANALLSEP